MQLPKGERKFQETFQKILDSLQADLATGISRFKYVGNKNHF